MYRSVKRSIGQRLIIIFLPVFVAPKFFRKIIIKTDNLGRYAKTIPFMLICDLTQAYTETSGGIRTFVHEKQHFILQHTDYRHLLIVPGERDSVIKRGRLTIATIEAPPVAGCEPFRFILRLDKVYQLLARFKPDLIELGSAYVLPFPALAYKTRFRKPLVGFYHTDYPTAYVKPAITGLAGVTVGRLAEKLSAHYAKFIYNKYDATVTSSTALYKKLKRKQ